jgi:hypothetical protein
MGIFTDVPYEIAQLLKPTDRFGERLIEDKLRPLFKEVNAIYLDVWLNRMENRAREAMG